MNPNDPLKPLMDRIETLQTDPQFQVKFPTICNFLIPLIREHALSGIDVRDPRYLAGIETAFNEMGTMEEE